MNIEEPGLRDRFSVRHHRFCGDEIVTGVSAQSVKSIESFATTFLLPSLNSRC